MQRGIISQTLDWFEHPINSEANISAWFAFLVLVLIASFLWSTVVAQVLDEA